MEFLLSTLVPTTTISVNPPGGTGHPHEPPSRHLPLPTDTFPSPHVRFLHATGTGHVALWVIFALFTAGLLGVWILALRVEKRARIFHWLSAAILTIAMVSYLAMATGLGVTYIPIHNHGSKASIVHLLRQVYYARYIDWLFTTPLLLISLAFLAGLSPAATLLTVLADIFMIVTGLFAGLHPARWAGGERARWLWFAISCVGFVVVWVTLLNGGIQAAKLRQRKTRGLFYLMSGMTFILWAAYPIVFGLTEGANKVSVNTEIIAYGVLDVAAKLGFTYLLLLIHTHGEDDTWILPEWFVEPRQGLGGLDGRTGYGAIRVD
ncbi:hypothetical protein BCR39DRAFT_524418 [Naematelia encephala]|uniref:Uncharacterized protein n=1 Tax=Naematelia encephala TaxID=71784 RepID=A0A1Y2BBE7_9TREE|nr:hypothetical protein BCR39DRAFT_524418 [Naematelia encephala]